MDGGVKFWIKCVYSILGHFESYFFGAKKNFFMKEQAWMVRVCCPRVLCGSWVALVRFSNKGVAEVSQVVYLLQGCCRGCCRGCCSGVAGGFAVGVTGGVAGCLAFSCLLSPKTFTLHVPRGEH